MLGKTKNVGLCHCCIFHINKKIIYIFRRLVYGYQTMEYNVIYLLRMFQTDGVYEVVSCFLIGISMLYVKYILKVWMNINVCCLKIVDL